MNDRIEHEEPRCKKSKTDMEDPTLPMPIIDTEELKRAKLRRDKDDPNWLQSNKDREDPNRQMLLTDNDDPRRAKLRSETDDPK